MPFVNIKRLADENTPAASCPNKWFSLKVSNKTGSAGLDVKETDVIYYSTTGRECIFLFQKEKKYHREMYKWQVVSNKYLMFFNTHTNTLAHLRSTMNNRSVLRKPPFVTI